MDGVLVSGRGEMGSVTAREMDKYGVTEPTEASSIVYKGSVLVSFVNVGVKLNDAHVAGLAQAPSFNREMVI